MSPYDSAVSFQQMNNYAIYRIAETLRVLLFMTLSILVFNFYPVTAVMIVMLALLNERSLNKHEVDDSARTRVHSPFRTSRTYFDERGYLFLPASAD